MVPWRNLVLRVAYFWLYLCPFSRCNEVYRHYTACQNMVKRPTAFNNWKPIWPRLLILSFNFFFTKCTQITMYINMFLSACIICINYYYASRKDHRHYRWKFYRQLLPPSGKMFPKVLCQWLIHYMNITKGTVHCLQYIWYAQHFGNSICH